MGKGGGDQQSSTQTIQKADPWSGVIPYLLGTPGTAATPGTAGIQGSIGGWAPAAGPVEGGYRGLELGLPGMEAGQWYQPGTAATLGTAGTPGTPGTPGLFPSAAEWFSSQKPEYFPGQTTAQPDWAFWEALGRQENRAILGSREMNDAKGNLLSTQQGSYLNTFPMQQLQQLSQAQTNPGMEQLQQLFGGLNNPAMGQLGNLASGQPQSQNPLYQLLQNIAQGGMLNANPYIDPMFNQAAGRVGDQFKNTVMPQLASMYSQAGRYGSNAMNQSTDTAQGNLGDTLNNLATNIYGQNYANERQLQQAASGMLGAQYGNDINSRIAAATSQGQQYSTDRGQQIGIGTNLGNLFNQGQQNRIGAATAQGNLMSQERDNMMKATALAPIFAQNDYADIDRLMQSSQMKQQLAQSNINADINKWNFNQTKDLNKLNSLSQILQGFGGGSSTSNTTGTQPGPQSSPLAGALGGASMMTGLGSALGGASAGGGLGTAAGFMTGGWGALAGAVLGGLFS